MNDRARIPFALLGVLLLVSSAALAPAFQGSPATGEPDVDVAMDRLTGQVQTAMREGIESGARAAGRNPVTAAANTSVGRVLDDDTVFRDALALRVHAAVADRLERTTADRRGLDLSASLPRPESTDDLREVLRRTNVSRAGPNGTHLRVHFENVTLTAERGDRIVGQRQLSPTLVTPNPVLAVHDRVDRFESLLSAGPLEPGLGSRLTAMLYGVTWARGYAQYANLPIQNVVTNRHVGLLANGAVLRYQDRIFGGSDPVGRATFRELLAVTGAVDALGVAAPSAKAIVQRVREERRTAEPLEPGLPVDALAGNSSHAKPTEERPVGVNETADAVFVDVMGSLLPTLQEVFSADVRVVARDVRRSGAVPEAPSPPDGHGWSRARTWNETTASVSETNLGPVAAPEGWHRLAAYPRRVDLTHERFAVFERGSQRVRRSTSTSETVDLSLQVEGYHANGEAPEADLVGFHEPGGPLGGDNFAHVRERATERLITDNGGPDEVAASAARRDWDGIQATFSGDQPDDLLQWIYRDVAALRDRVRNLSTTTTLGKLATHQARPVEDLVTDLRALQDHFVDAPSAYESVSTRARDAIRYQFVTGTIGALEDRVRNREQRRSRLGEKMAEQGDGGLQTLRGGYERRNVRADLTPLGLDMRIDAAPAYLSRYEVTAEDVPALGENESLHPLVTRNFNLFTLPYGDVADFVARVLSGPKRVTPKTALDVLRAHRQLHEIDRNAAAMIDLNRLESEVDAGLRRMSTAMADFLANEGAGFPADRQKWETLIRGVLSQYDRTFERTKAVLDGSVGKHIVRSAAETWPETFESGSWRRDYLDVRTRQYLAAAADESDFGPRLSTTNGTVTDSREVIQDELESQLTGAMQNATLETLRSKTNSSWPRQPAGLPISPTFLPWLVTTNTWMVEVAGEYARFAVRVPRGRPIDPGGSFAYVRDGDEVRVDLLPGGGTEHLGNASRVSFRTETWVGIAVPPGGPGVGDVDGDQDETSGGWPSP